MAGVNTLQNMQALVHVVETGSFVAASRRMELSTAQVSRLVAELEEHLKTKLLNRTTRSLALTEAGERYFERARGIIASIGEAETEASGAHVRASGTLRIHCHASFALHRIIPLIAHYRREYPEVSVELTLAQRIPKITEEGFDIALVLSPALQDSGVVVRRIATSEAVLCASPRYLKKHGVPKTPADLSRHACLNLLFPGVAGVAEGWSFTGPSGVVETVGLNSPFTVNVAEAMLRAIDAGMGVGLLPEYSASRALREGTMVRVLPGYRMHEINIFALYPARKFLDAKIGTWLDFLDKHLPAAMAADRSAPGRRKRGAQ